MTLPSAFHYEKKKVEFPCNLFFLHNQQLVYAHKHIPSQVNNIELVLMFDYNKYKIFKKMKILKTQKESLIFLGFVFCNTFVMKFSTLDSSVFKCHNPKHLFTREKVRLYVSNFP